MINAHGLDEAGIDGGGVFREFMSQLLHQGFDPSYGFFQANSKQLLYPNPDVQTINADYVKHFHFLAHLLRKIKISFFFTRLETIAPALDPVPPKVSILLLPHPKTLFLFTYYFHWHVCFCPSVCLCI